MDILTNSLESSLEFVTFNDDLSALSLESHHLLDFYTELVIKSCDFLADYSQFPLVLSGSSTGIGCFRDPSSQLFDFSGHPSNGGLVMPGSILCLTLNEVELLLILSFLTLCLGLELLSPYFVLVEVSLLPRKFFNLGPQCGTHSLNFLSQNVNLVLVVLELTVGFGGQMEFVLKIVSY